MLTKDASGTKSGLSRGQVTPEVLRDEVGQ